MQKKVYNLRFKLLMALSAILLIVPGLLMTQQPARASEAVVNDARPAAQLSTDQPIDAKLSIITWSNPKWIDVFTIKNSDGTVWHNYQIDGAWDGWHSLGKPGTYNLTSVSAVAWAAGRIDVFAHSFSGPTGQVGNIWHTYQNGAGTNWAAWEHIGGGSFSEVQAVSWGAGRLDVFSEQPTGPNGTPLYNKAWQGSWFPSQGWNAIETPVQMSGSLHVVSWGPNRLDLFKRAWDNNMYYKYWNGSAWKPSVGGWTNLGGLALDTPYAVSWAPNRLDVFARGTDQAVWVNSSSNGGSNWSGWNSLGGGPSSRTPTAVSWAANRLDVFENRSPGYSSGNIYHKWWNGSAWGPAGSTWEWLGPVSFSNPPKVVSWEVNRLDLFGRSETGTVYHKWQSNFAWGPSLSGAWESLGAP